MSVHLLPRWLTDHLSNYLSSYLSVREDSENAWKEWLQIEQADVPDHLKKWLNFVQGILIFLI